jgi:hypothetical protein
MKIVLEAFNGKMRSAVMDIPDNSGDRWKMILDIGDFKKIGYSGDVLSTKPSMPKACTFEWTGEWLATRPDSAKIYQLVDIEN